MASTITVRDIAPGDKAWLRREAHRMGISMEELVRRLIRKERQRSKLRETPSAAFRMYFGPSNGVNLPPRERFRHRQVEYHD